MPNSTNGNLPMRHRTSAPNPDRRLLPLLTSLTWFSFVALAVVYGLLGRTMLEKTLTALACPCGLIWMLLVAIGCWMWRSGLRGTAWAVLGAWLILTLGGNAWVSHTLIGQLEAPWRQIDGVQGEPFDVVVVLGGGTSERDAGGAQLAEDGERVITAARMYHAGKTKRILCTGTQVFLATDNDLHPREETEQILLGLGVPAAAIDQIEGINTFQEMKTLREWVASQPTAKTRIGIITSAYHLSRAMRLASANGFSAEPIPANFLANRITASPSWVIPSSVHLKTTAAALKEHLAAALGR